MHLAWGSEGPHDYRGDLEVRVGSGGDWAEPDQASELLVHLHTERVEPDDKEEVQGRIDTTMRTIKQLAKEQHAVI